MVAMSYRLRGNLIHVDYCGYCDRFTVCIRPESVGDYYLSTYTRNGRGPGFDSVDADVLEHFARASLETMERENSTPQASFTKELD